MKKEVAQSTIMPVLVMIALSSSSGLEIILDSVGIPSEPLIILFWESILPGTEFPEYAIQYSDILFFLAFSGAVVKFLMDWSVDTTPDGLTQGDKGAVVFIFLSSLFLVFPLQGVEVTAIVAIHLGVIFGLNVLFTILPPFMIDVFSGETHPSRFLMLGSIIGMTVVVTYFGSLVMVWVSV